MRMLIAILLLTQLVSAQSSSLPKPASDKATYFSAAELTAAINTAVNQPQGRIVPVLDAASYAVNLRRNDRMTPANMHPTTAEFYIIREGTATLVTGGTLKDPTRNANGDFNGSGVTDGERRIVKSGDAVFIPAGVPHTWEDIQGSISYYNVRFLSK